MKTLLKIFLLLILLISNLSILKAQSITWQKNFGGPDSESSRFGIQTSDGDYVILYLKIGENGGTYLLDLDPYGNERWNKKINLIGTGVYIQQTNDGGFIMCGASTDDGTLVKTDRLGNLVWNRSYHINNQSTQFQKVKIIDSGNLLVCGIVSFFPVKALVMRLDSLGNFIWQSILNYPDEADAFDIITDNYGFIYFTGGIRINNSYKTLFSKLNSKGEILWFKYYGSEGFGDSQGGNSIVSGNNNQLFISGPLSYSFNTRAHFTKIDSSGNVIFQNQIPQTAYSNSMCNSSNGYYAIGGEGFSGDMMFLLLNNTGVIISQKFFLPYIGEDQGARSIVETSDKGFLLSGYTSFEPNRIAGTANLYIIKTDSKGNSPVSIKNLSSEIPSSFKLYQNYPNPFNPVTNLEFQIPKSGFVTLKIYDMLGKEIAALVNDNLNPGTYRFKFDGSNFASGVYFYKLTAGDFTAVKRMVLIK